MEENETTSTEEQNTEEQQSEKEEVIWGQLRVPNIKKGTNPYYPFIMMGTVGLIIILSFVFAKFTS